ncbi:protein-tyrosine-phosphatase [Paraburkholderia phenazinium]|uniref:protein-tyrosine-phosphatase n=1 Tax=Paraburkholderia phenazinium TaxID=60549 RepID=A0A1G7QEF6_9BURK|nr:protein-tyrosine-phosphatase [Paraburkholderia phenazinium]SDF95980.1 protein-tyrosine phosphatase [Paraburkholderia phenazinium]
MNTILVICTANVCRSPMAEALFKQALPSLRVLSAGIDAVPGMRADPRVVALLESEGLYVGEHRSQQLFSWMIEAAYPVLVMSERQKRVVEHRHPAARGRVFRLLEECDISDPYKKGAEAYRVTHSNICEGVERWSWHLSRLEAEAKSGVCA